MDINARQALAVLNVQASYLTSLKHQRLVHIAEETVRERGIIKGQIEALYRQQLKSKLDLSLVQVELTNAESLLVRARNGLKSSFANLNRAMGIAGAEDYVLEDLPIEVRPQPALDTLISDSLAHPEFRRAKELTASAEARVTAPSGNIFRPSRPMRAQATFRCTTRAAHRPTRREAGGLPVDLFPCRCLRGS
jgi:outer membrane protein